jgi:hypothetical protein
MLVRVLGVLAACIATGGAATPASAGLLSATGPVFAIVAGDLFVGEAEGHLDGAGTLAIHSQKTPALTCTGEFTSSAESGGKGQMRCTNGITATFEFKRLTLRSGYGTGKLSRGTMSFTYGLSAEEASRYLKPPKGKRLRQDGNGLELFTTVARAPGSRAGSAAAPAAKA